MRYCVIFLFISSLAFGSSADYFDKMQVAQNFLKEQTNDAKPELIVVLTAGVSGIEELLGKTGDLR